MKMQMSKAECVIAPHHPRDGREWDCQCARCGSSMGWEDCGNCYEGYTGHDCGEDCCMCEYPIDNVPCGVCSGYEGWNFCCSSPEWCEANPIKGRESIERGKVEWFTFEAPGSERGGG